MEARTDSARVQNHHFATLLLNALRFVRRGLMVTTAHLAAYANVPASAGELYSHDDVELRWDNTVTYTTAFRLEGRNSRLIADPNADDGDRNFAPGIISNRFDLLSQIDFSKGWFGFDASAAFWYDTIYNQKNDNNSPSTFNPISVPHNQFPHAVRVLHGDNAELVNAFIYGNTTLAGMPFSFRVGRHTLLWGESLFFPDNGIAAGQAPVDDIKVLGRPTAYARDVFMPVAQASASLQLSDRVTAEAYYQFEWRKTRVPGAGSYFSAVDYLDAGGERYLFTSGQFLTRDRDLTPPGSGQFGTALHWSAGQIDYGLYALRFNAKDPQIYYRPGIVFGSGNPPTVVDPSIVDLTIGKVGTYNLVYPQGIETYGASVSGYLGSSNIAAEISGRRNMPLASIPLIVHPGQFADGNRNPLYAVGDTIHAQMSTITTFARTMFWDTATLSAEFAANDSIRVTRNRPALDPSSDRLAVAFRGSFDPTYFAVLPNLDLTPSLGLGYNLVGNSSVDAYQKNGAGDLEFGVTGTYRVVWAANIMLSHFLGDARRQPLADRDFISLSVRRAF
jgi:hypothetical protein